MFKQALACVQSHQSLHCSRTCAKWAYIPHILSVNAQTSLIVCVVFLLSHMHEMGVHMTYFQSMLRRDLVCMQSYQSIHCSRTYTKWVCLWHILLVNVQTSLNMQEVPPEPSLHSHMRKMGLRTAYSFSQCSDEPYCVCSLPALAHARNGRTYDIFSVNAQTRLSMHGVLPEHSLLSHIHKMGVFVAYFISQCSNKP